VQITSQLTAFVVLHFEKPLGEDLKFGGALQDYRFQLGMGKSHLLKLRIPHKVLLSGEGVRTVPLLRLAEIIPFGNF
jgi:hypothetical protein